MAEPAAQGRLSITRPPAPGWAGAVHPRCRCCPANPSHRTQGGEGGSPGCARSQNVASTHQLPGRASHCRHLPPNSPHSAGRGCAYRAGMRSSLGKKQGGRGRRGDNEATAPEAYPCPGVRQGGRHGRSGEAAGGEGWGLPAWCAPQAVHPMVGCLAPIRPQYLAASQSLSVASVQVDQLGLSPQGGGGAVTVTPATWGSLTCSPGWRAVCCSRGCWPPALASC